MTDHLSPFVLGPRAGLCLALLVGSLLSVGAQAQTSIEPPHSNSAKTQARAKTAPKPATAAMPKGAANLETLPSNLGPNGDYILVVVNRELISAGEVARRMALASQDAQLNHSPLPPSNQLRQQVLDALIDERALLTYARDIGQRIDDAEIDRTLLRQAKQNQLTLSQFKERLQAEGINFTTFRNHLRDQLMIERVREREMQTRIRISENDIEGLLAQKLGEAGAELQYNVAQILVKTPDNPNEAVVAEKRLVAEQAFARLQSGEPMSKVAKDLSEDDNKDKGGAMGLRPASRLPDVFLAQISKLKAGELAPEILRTDAGFHVLQLIERRSASSVELTQTRARHILLRPTSQLSRAMVVHRLLDLKREIEAGRQTFEKVALENSQDGSAALGGDLGWTLQGSFVPEFESAMNELATGSLSEPVVSRFGVHLIQVVARRQVPVEMKQLREMARNMLREQRFESAYADWQRELRAQAYIEFRDAPSP